MNARRSPGCLLTTLLGVLASLCLMPAQAATYVLPENGDSVIGEVQTVIAVHEDTLLSLGRRHGAGYEEMVAANPRVDVWLPGAGTEVVIPSRYVLPDAPREGIVVNLSEHRLYYFPPARAGEPRTVQTYPISVGKMDWKTPLGVTTITNKRERPTWYPPESVRREHAAQGRFLPRAVPPGPDNPMGNHAMRLGIPGGAYLIHGTNRPEGVGMQVTHGCIRMFPENIQSLYGQVGVGTKVRMVDQPHKMGWLNGELYMEVHTPLEGGESAQTHSLTSITRALVAATEDSSVPLDWARAERVFQRAEGIPEPVMLRQVVQQVAHEVEDPTAN